MTPRTPEAGTAGSRDAERAAFIARLTAGATHELRNFFAIVKESAGLVGDLVEVAGDRPASAEKVDWALERIRLQIERGTQLTDSLNRVMHGLDHPTETVELGTAVRHAGLLAQRFARRRECEIRVEEGPEVSVTVNALDLFRTLVELMEWCVDRLPPQSVLAVRPEAADGPAVRFTPEPEPLRALEEAESQSLDTIVEPVAGRVTYADGALLLLLTATTSG
jgi:C4-dicarboxylate-specific signal transduction histidine kinase